MPQRHSLIFNHFFSLLCGEEKFGSSQHIVWKIFYHIYSNQSWSFSASIYMGKKRPCLIFKYCPWPGGSSALTSAPDLRMACAVQAVWGRLHGGESTEHMTEHMGKTEQCVAWWEHRGGDTACLPSTTYLQLQPHGFDPARLGAPAAPSTWLGWTRPTTTDCPRAGARHFV